MIRPLYIQGGFGLKTILDSDRIPFSEKLKPGSVKLISRGTQKERYTIYTNPNYLQNVFREISRRIIGKVVPLHYGSWQSKVYIHELFSVEKTGKVLAHAVVDGEKVPLVIQKKGHIYFLIDVEKEFTSLLFERYRTDKKDHVLSASLTEKVYKLIPYFLRMYVYRAYYRKLHATMKNKFVTTFPVDTSAFSLMKLIELSILEFTDIIKIGRWPNKKEAAFAVSHDTEPYVQSYTEGIWDLLDTLDRFKKRSCISLVGSYVRYLSDSQVTRMAKHEVICHGLYHDRNFDTSRVSERKRRVQEGKRLIEKRLGITVKGFRAPTFQRTKDLGMVLQDAGYGYDMSYIDSQREEPGCGHGVSFFLPYYLEKSAMLELPTSAPDCISPYYFGYSLKETRKLFVKKIDWLISVNGMINFIVHSPIWGKPDSTKRMDLLSSLLNYCADKNVWDTTPGEIADWWKAREGLSLQVVKNKIVLKNKTDSRVQGISVIIQSKDTKTRYINHIEAYSELECGLVT